MKEKMNRGNKYLLLISIFTIATCGLIYELLAGTISSYLLGDSIYQFSLVIGLFMTAMGIGSYLSRFIEDKLATYFVVIEIILGLVGGFSTIILFLAFSKIDNYSPILFIISTLIGILAGLEIPIIMRIMKDYSLKIMISNVLTLDYIGALAASLLFPIILLPQMGLIRTGLFFGIFNIIIAFVAIYIFKDIISNKKKLIISSSISIIILIIAFAYSSKITTLLEDSLYSNNIIYATTTPYQRIVVTKNRNNISLFINGSIQFSTKDEYRYHEALVHPVMLQSRQHKNILVLGGGDGMACREILKYKDVEKVTLVDLDPAMTKLFKENRMFIELNSNALNNKKVQVINGDAWKYLEKSEILFDVIIVDLPDPHGVEISRLYSQTFYKMLANHLSADGAMVTQSTSPLYAKEAFWCIYNTMQTINSPFQLTESLSVTPYHLYLPSFGEWGFVMASPKKIKWKELKIQTDTKYLDKDSFQNMISFPKDMKYLDTEINSINTHKLVKYYENGWDEWFK